MDGFLRQNTAATLKLGPFVNDTDGKTAETALAITQADVRLSKNGGTMAQKNSAAACTADALGMYSCPLDATDTGTLGLLTVNVHEAGALPIKQTYMVMPANAWDSLFGTDTLNAAVTEWNGVALATTNPLPNAAAGAAGGLPTDAAGKIGFNDVSAADVNAQCDAAIETYHLDHLLAANYDPAAKPGVPTALLNTLVENNAGTPRFTAHALAQAPGGGGDATAANQTTIINHLTDIKGTGFVTDTHSLTDILTDVTGLNGAAMRGTDNALLAASAPANFADLAITATTGKVTVGTNDDKLGYGLASGAITAATFATDAIDATVITNSAWQEAADQIMSRATSNYEDVAAKKSLATAVIGAVHKIEDNGQGSLVIYKSDDTIRYATRTILTNVNLQPVEELGGAVSPV